MDMHAAPASDATIFEDIELLKSARDCAIQECQRLVEFYDQFANVTGNLAQISVTERTFIHSITSRIFIGESIFAKKKIEELRGSVQRVFRLLNPVASEAKTFPCNGCGFSACVPCTYECESAHSAAGSRNNLFIALLEADAFIPDRVDHYDKIADSVREKIRTRDEIPDIAPCHLRWQSFHNVPKSDSWIFNGDWIDPERAANGLKVFTAQLPNGDGTFYRELKVKVLEESKRAIAFAQQCRYATGPIMFPSASAAPEHAPAYDASDGLDPDDRKLLQAVFTLGAVNRESRKTQAEVARQIEPHARDSENVKRPLRSLVKRGFLDSQQYRGGGVWLTTLGLETVRS